MKEKLLIGIAIGLGVIAVVWLGTLSFNKSKKLGVSFSTSGNAPTVLTDLKVTGDFEVVGTSQSDGASSVTGALSAGTTTVGKFIQGGTALALTGVATSTLTASQVCNSSFISITPVSSTPTITLPSTTTLFASCLGTTGQVMDVNVQAITTSSILAAGAGGTSLNSSSLTIAAGKAAILRFVHDTASTYLVFVVNLVN